jgi:hypothetical protein
MPLDPQLQPILDLMEGELRVDDKTPDEARAYTSAGNSPRDDTGLASVTDIEVGGADGTLPARVYRPEGAAEVARSWCSSTAAGGSSAASPATTTPAPASPPSRVAR